MPYKLPQKTSNLGVTTLDLYLNVITLILIPYPKQDMKRIILEIHLLAGSPGTI